MQTQVKTLSQDKANMYVHPVTQMKFYSKTLFKGDKAKLFEFENMNKYFHNRSISFIVQHFHTDAQQSSKNLSFKHIVE